MKTHIKQKFVDEIFKILNSANLNVDDKSQILSYAYGQNRKLKIRNKKEDDTKED